MKHVLFLFTLLLLLEPLRADQQTEESQCIGVATRTFERLNLVLIQNNMPDWPFDPDHLKVSHPQDFIRKINLIELITPQRRFIKFLPESCELIQLTRDDFIYSQSPTYEKLPTPTWTKDQVVNQGSKYATAIFGSFPKNIAAPIVELEQNNGPKFYPPIWHIRWPRVDKEGHLFNVDAVHIHISESLGLIDAKLNFVSNYQEPQGPLISKEEALKIAGPAAQTLAARIGGNLNLGACESEEIIVNPNHVFQVKKVTLVSSEARLAWNVIYQITSNGLPTDHQVHVAIDAQTSEAIDGDYH